MRAAASSGRLGGESANRAAEETVLGARTCSGHCAGLETQIDSFHGVSSGV